MLDQFVQQLQYVRFLGDPFHTAPSASTQIIYKTEWTATMHAYRNCVKLIQRIDREYKFEILDTERKKHQELEMGKYIMYLEEYSVLHPGFARFRNDMKEHAASEQREEEEPPEEGTWPEFGDDRHHAQMSGMLCRLNTL